VWRWGSQMEPEREIKKTEEKGEEKVSGGNNTEKNLQRSLTIARKEARWTKKVGHRTGNPRQIAAEPRSPTQLFNTATSGQVCRQRKKPPIVQKDPSALAFSNTNLKKSPRPTSTGKKKEARFNQMEGDRENRVKADNSRKGPEQRGRSQNRPHELGGKKCKEAAACSRGWTGASARDKSRQNEGSSKQK